MLESASLIAIDLLYLFAYLTTACVYLFWNELLTAAASLIVFCLSNPSSPILLSMLKLHSLVLVFFVLAVCFQLTSAEHAQTGLVWSSAANHTLGFDDLSTDDSGFGYVPVAYHHMNFNGLYPFNPHANAFNGKISEHDLNCAFSAPNGLYGARYESGRNRLMGVNTTIYAGVPTIHIDARSAAVFGLESSFTLHSLKIKPLDFPFSHTTLYLEGYTSEEVLHWQVDFPLGFHDMLHVKVEQFSKRKWQGLERLEIFADLHYDGGDWEFCFDDLEVEFHSREKDTSAQTSDSRLG